MKDWSTQGDRVIAHLITHTDEREIQPFLVKAAYYLQIPICKQTFVDMSAIDPAAPLPEKPLDLYQESREQILKNAADKASIPGGYPAVLFVLIKNDHRRPGEKIYHTVVTIWKREVKEFKQHVATLQELLEKKGKR